MFESVVEDIGDFEAVWSVHDNARIYTSWSQRRLLQESVTDGTRKFHLRTRKEIELTFQVWRKKKMRNRMAGLRSVPPVPTSHLHLLPLSLRPTILPVHPNHSYLHYRYLTLSATTPN